MKKKIELPDLSKWFDLSKPITYEMEKPVFQQIEVEGISKGLSPNDIERELAALSRAVWRHERDMDKARKAVQQNIRSAFQADFWTAVSIEPIPNLAELRQLVITHFEDIHSDHF